MSVNTVMWVFCAAFGSAGNTTISLAGMALISLATALLSACSVRLTVLPSLTWNRKPCRTNCASALAYSRRPPLSCTWYRPGIGLSLIASIGRFGCSDFRVWRIAWSGSAARAMELARPNAAAAIKRDRRMETP
ncbi:hypothetical protein D3C85_1544560 [compost metagenome]